MEVYDGLMRIGKISHFSSNHRLIAKMETNNTPSIGLKVFDSELHPIGVILDVFGPTASPYISIKPAVPEPQKLTGRVVYADKKRR